MSDVQLSSERILDRLGHEELRLKQLGMPNHAAGVRTAIVAVLRLAEEARAAQPPEPKS